MRTLDRARLGELAAQEERRFVDEHPRSAALFDEAKRTLLGGVPMSWMTKWAGSFPVYVDHAKGGHFVDVDGHAYIDFCLGDTGAMTGHAPPATVEAIVEQLQLGISHMLPTAHAAEVGAELTARFGLPAWQFCLSATDANRFAIRYARGITGRPKVLVFDRCYHGTVDETFAVRTGEGRVVARRGNIGPPVDPAVTTRVVDFNDVTQLEAELAQGDVAVVLAEPAMTNVGIVLPDPGYHDALRALTRKYGTLLLLDETHTICCGPGGYTQAHGLEPDLLVMGKPIGSGIPCAAYGFIAELAERAARIVDLEDCDVAGVGGTLAGYALSMAAMRATLRSVLTAESYDHTVPLAERWTEGVGEVIERHEVPWHVTRLGCRAEYHFTAQPPRTGRQAWDAGDFELERFLHLYALNRGILMTPFHNMALMCAAHTDADVDRHTEVFEAAVTDLFGS